MDPPGDHDHSCRERANDRTRGERQPVARSADGVPGDECVDLRSRQRDTGGELADEPALDDVDDLESVNLETRAQQRERCLFASVGERGDGFGKSCRLRPGVGLCRPLAAEVRERERSDADEHDRGDSGGEDREQDAAAHASAEPVPDTPDGVERKSVAELLAKLADVDVDRALVAVPIWAPHTVEELLAAQRQPGVFGQKRQEVELSRRQRHR